MKGLLKNSLYGAMGSVSIALVFFVIFGVVLIIVNDVSYIQFFTLPCVTVFALIALTSFRRDMSTNWSKQMIAAPVTRKKIVKSRYIFFTLCVAAGVIVVAVILALMLAVRGGGLFYNAIRDVAALIGITIGIPLLMGGIFYPFVSVVGADKNEILSGISLVGAVAIAAGLIWLLNISFGTNSISDVEFLAGMAVFYAIVVALFIASYFLTVALNKKKEY